MGWFEALGTVVALLAVFATVYTSNKTLRQQANIAAEERKAEREAARLERDSVRDAAREERQVQTEAAREERQAQTEAAREERQAQTEATRGTGRQELRFTSYGMLWAQMRALAIYDDSPINRQTMKDMSKKLSDWYFSINGGLMLTSHNRDLYFALQDLVRRVAGAETEWEAERIPEPRETFEAVLEREGLKKAKDLIEHLEMAAPQDWPSDDLEEMARAWRKDVVTLATGWAEIDSRQRFAVLQQVGSVLRTGLANDVETAPMKVGSARRPAIAPRRRLQVAQPSDGCSWFHS